MMGFIFLFGLLLGACYWIINPLLREDDRQNGFTPKPEDILQELKNKKNGAYATIRELEFDLSMGKLTEEDFQILKGQYTQEAFGYMKEIDKLESLQATLSKPADTRFEEEIEQGDEEIRSHVSTERKYIYCTSCGEMAGVGSRFCVACGANLDKHRKNYLQEEN
jgi:tRNA nucleotidyltransferase/poly(A) polymerase